MAASTVTFEHFRSAGFGRIIATCTADSTDGSYVATAIPVFTGRLLLLRTNPGATAPSANYDITLVDADSIDRLQGVGANRHTSTTEEVSVVYSGTAIHPAVCHELLTLTLAGNLVNSAVTVVTLVYGP